MSIGGAFMCTADRLRVKYRVGFEKALLFPCCALENVVE